MAICVALMKQRDKGLSIKHLPSLQRSCVEEVFTVSELDELLRIEKLKKILFSRYLINYVRSAAQPRACWRDLLSRARLDARLDETEAFPWRENDEFCENEVMKELMSALYCDYGFSLIAPSSSCTAPSRCRHHSVLGNDHHRRYTDRDDSWRAEKGEREGKNGKRNILHPTIRLREDWTLREALSRQSPINEEWKNEKHTMDTTTKAKTLFVLVHGFSGEMTGSIRRAITPIAEHAAAHTFSRRVVGRCLQRSLSTALCDTSGGFRNLPTDLLVIVIGGVDPSQNVPRVAIEAAHL